MTVSAIPLQVGGTSLWLGVKPKLGAMAILGSLAGVSPVMHGFGRNQDPEEQNTDMIIAYEKYGVSGRCAGTDGCRRAVGSERSARVTSSCGQSAEGEPQDCGVIDRPFRNPFP